MEIKFRFPSAAREKANQKRKKATRGSMKQQPFTVEIISCENCLLFTR